MNYRQNNSRKPESPHSYRTSESSRQPDRRPSAARAESRVGAESGRRGYAPARSSRESSGAATPRAGSAEQGRRPASARAGLPSLLRRPAPRLVPLGIMGIVACTVTPAQTSEERAQHLATFLAQHPRRHRKRMVEPSVGIQLVKRPKRACLGVGRAVNAAGHTRVHHKTRTHNAGLEGHIHRAAREPPASERAGCRDHRRELRMRRGVFVQLTTVVRPGDNFAFVDHNSPDGHLAFRRCRMRLDQRLANEALVEPAQRHVDIPLVAHGRPSFSRRSVFDAIITYHGEMAERLNAAVLKTVGRVSVSRVRIPLSPPW